MKILNTDDFNLVENCYFITQFTFYIFIGGHWVESSGPHGISIFVC